MAVSQEYGGTLRGEISSFNRALHDGRESVKRIESQVGMPVWMHAAAKEDRTYLRLGDEEHDATQMRIAGVLESSLDPYAEIRNLCLSDALQRAPGAEKAQGQASLLPRHRNSLGSADPQPVPRPAPPGAGRNLLDGPPKQNGDDSCRDCQQELFKAHSPGPHTDCVGGPICRLR